MIWTKNPENRCKLHQIGAWNATSRELISLVTLAGLQRMVSGRAKSELKAMTAQTARPTLSALALSLLLATGAVAEESSPTPEKQQIQARPPRSAPMPGQQCAPRHVMVEGLKAQYGEDPIAWGIHPDGLFLIEVYAARDGSTFTLLTTIAQTRMSCVVGVGKHWTQGTAALAPGEQS